MKRNIKTQAQVEKTYTVGVINSDFVVCDESTNLKSYEKFEVKEGQPWYGTVEMLIDMDIKDILIAGKSIDEIIETFKKMSNQEFMDMVKKRLGEKGIEKIYLRSGQTRIDDFCDNDYIANGIKGREYTISHLTDTFIDFQAEIKYKFWIENGVIKHEPVWEFEK